MSEGVKILLSVIITIGFILLAIFFPEVFVFGLMVILLSILIFLVCVGVYSIISIFTD